MRNSLLCGEFHLYLLNKWIGRQKVWNSGVSHNELGLIEERFRSGGLRTSKNPLLNKINKSTGKKNDQNQVFQNSGINQRLATIQGPFIQEKWLNLCENSKLCGILICSIPIPPLSLTSH